MQRPMDAPEAPRHGVRIMKATREPFEVPFRVRKAGCAEGEIALLKTEREPIEVSIRLER